MRHEQEEQRAKQMLREEEGTGRKGRLNIDLSSGTVVIGADSVGGAATTTKDEDSSAEDDTDRPAERRVVRPAEPRVKRSSGAVPTGKKQRTGAPVGKSRRGK